MSENRIISWDVNKLERGGEYKIGINFEEAERILGETSNEPVKSSLPQQTRPTEPDNDTDVTNSTQRLAQNDPKLVEINLNNMKVYSPFGYSNGLLGEGNRGIGWMDG